MTDITASSINIKFLLHTSHLTLPRDTLPIMALYCAYICTCAYTCVYICMYVEIFIIGNVYVLYKTIALLPILTFIISNMTLA